MKIKVIKSSSENYWYNNHIGEVFEVVEELNQHKCVLALPYQRYYYSFYKGEGKNKIGFYIGIEDCEIVE